MVRGANWLAMWTLLILAAGCHDLPSRANREARSTATVAHSTPIRQVDLRNPASPVSSTQPIALAAARNEGIDFAVELPPGTTSGLLKISPLSSETGGPIASVQYQAYQVMPVAVDMDRAAYVRHTGQTTAARSLPRALVPLKTETDGGIPLAGVLHDPSHPRSLLGPTSTEAPIIWIDVHVPSMTPAGKYSAEVALLPTGSVQAISSIPLHLEIYDFNIPNERHLQMVGRLAWDRLERLYPDRFETFTPSWLNRREDRYAKTLQTLDDLVRLAQANRAEMVIPALRPITKWPANGPPEIDWRDFDSLVGPWLSGDAFVDHVGLHFWPIPSAEMLDRYDRASQLAYWSQAISHFQQDGWADRGVVWLDKNLPGAVSATERIDLSNQAAQLLKNNGKVRVLLPLEDDQLQLFSANSEGIPLADTGRLVTTTPAIVSAPPMRPWPTNAPRPRHWLRTDSSGPMPYMGAGGAEQDVRVWAWLAFLRHVTTYGNTKSDPGDDLIIWDAVAPSSSSPAQGADPTELTWFYPGAWFGADGAVPSIQLKWLRRAEQDYEYLLMARQRGEVINALQMARLMTKPVELSPGQKPEPVYSLMSGTSDPATWDQARALLAQTILLREPGQEPDPARQREVYLRTMQWAAPQERPLLIARQANWSWSVPSESREGGNWVNLKLALDIYNASETTPDQNHLQWTQAPVGWEIHPQELSVPQLRTYHVLRAAMEQRFNLDRVSPQARQPMEMQFVDGFSKAATRLKLVLPVAASDRREGRLSIDGNLDDWSPEDAVQNGPMVRMFDRPAIQRQELEAASTSTRLYSSWAAENFYLAFSLEGLPINDGHAGRNFVEYQQRRAWGEDLAEILIQPIDANNRLGPVLHLVCKPNGVVSIERQSAANPSSLDGWQPVDSSPARYVSIATGGHWTGEIAIPWRLILGPGAEAPTLLRFNFAQHKAATGESASWAGPIDFGRDQSFMGLIYLRSPDQRGTSNIVQGGN